MSNAHHIGKWSALVRISLHILERCILYSSMHRSILSTSSPLHSYALRESAQSMPIRKSLRRRLRIRLGPATGDLPAPSAFTTATAHTADNERSLISTLLFLRANLCVFLELRAQSTDQWAALASARWTTCRREGVPRGRSAALRCCRNHQSSTARPAARCTALA